MANDFYNHGSVPANNAAGSSSDIRAEFDSVTSGFNKLPGLTGNGDKVVKINAGGTGMTVKASDAEISDTVHAATANATIADADEIGRWDSVALALRKITFANLWTWIQGKLNFGLGVATFLTTPTSANLRGALTDETGTGSAVFATSPTLVTPVLGTPASGTLTNCGGLPPTGLSSTTGTGAVVLANSPTLVTPNLGTPASGDLSNCTFPSSVSAFAAGTRLAFNQTAAPTGWTKDTTAALNDTAMRIVTGTVGSGGSAAFSTALGSPGLSGSTAGYTLQIADIPAHSHTMTVYSAGTSTLQTGINNTASGPVTFTTDNTGGGGAHSHGVGTLAVAINVKYNDFIIATKN